MKKKYSDALKKRLRRDCGSLLSDYDWDKDVWLDQKIGLFYDDDEQSVDIAIYEETRDVLKAENKKLTTSGREQLAADIKADTKCKDAVEEMFDASLGSVSIKKRL